MTQLWFTSISFLLPEAFDSPMGLSSLGSGLSFVRTKYPLDFLALCMSLSLVGSVQYMCPVVPLCIVDASLSHYVGN